MTEKVSIRVKADESTTIDFQIPKNPTLLQMKGFLDKTSKILKPFEVDIGLKVDITPTTYKKNKYYKWTKEVEDKLIEMNESGEYTFIQMGKILDLGNNAARKIKSKLQQLGIKPNSARKKDRNIWNKEKEKELMRLYNEGFTFKQIGEKLDINPNTVTARYYKIRKRKVCKNDKRSNYKK